MCLGLYFLQHAKVVKDLTKEFDWKFINSPESKNDESNNKKKNISIKQLFEKYHKMQMGAM